MSAALSLFVNKPTWEVMKEQATTLMKSGLLPSWITKPEAVIAIMLKGHEVRIPPMQAIAHMSFVNGRVALSAELMLALIYRDCPSAVILFKKLENDRCIIQAARSPQHSLTMFSFTIVDAGIAQLTGKDNWKNYPRAMCRSRAVAEMARTLFADVIMGCSYTREELAPDEPVTIDLDDIEPLRTLEDPIDPIETASDEIRLLASIIGDENKSKVILDILENNRGLAPLSWYEKTIDKVKKMIEDQQEVTN